MSAAAERRARNARALYVAFATGADLAALTSLVAARLRGEPECNFAVFFGNYGDVSPDALEELLGLKDVFLRRLALYFIMEREPEEGELLTGRLDAQKVDALARKFFAPLDVSTYFLLGAVAQVEQLQASLLNLGVAAQNIRVPAPTAPAGAVTPGALAPGAPPVAAGMTQVEVVMDGRRRAFTMRTGEESILDAAARAGLDLPFSCRAGVCSTCRTKLVRGEVELAQNYALEDWELAQGFILACQAHAKTAQLEITYDET
jgi:ring-1,2-phenylacetyl-CoA epoxidase subunit PaaE